MIRPIVSIIIPIYNVEEYITDCLNSVMQQTTKANIECLLVDDCGKDRSMERAKSIIHNYNGSIKLRIIERERNGGLSAARNSGIKESLGEYLYFLDSDDMITPDAIEVLLEVASLYPRAEIITGKFIMYPGNRIHSVYSLKNIKGDINIVDNKNVRATFLSDFPVMAWNKLVKRDFLISNLLYFREGILHEDNYWQAQAYGLVKNIAICNRVTYLYRLRSNSIMSNTRTLKSLNAHIITAKEMFTKQKEWDKPWAIWALNQLNLLKFGGFDVESKELSKKGYKAALDAIFNNTHVPKGLQRIFRYHALKRPIMRVSVVNRLTNLYFRGI